MKVNQVRPVVIIETFKKIYTQWLINYQITLSLILVNVLQILEDSCKVHFNTQVTAVWVSVNVSEQDLSLPHIFLPRHLLN